MLRTKLAKRILTKKEQQHLTDQGIHNMGQMLRQAENIRGTKKMHPESWTQRVCLECNHILNKLDLWGKP